MSRQPTINRFIGREKEVAYFRDWLDNAHAPKMLYFYDAAEDPEHKGGIGKTYLLRYCADLVSKRQDISLVIADFFNVADRDSIFLAEHVISSLQRLFPNWTPTAFQTVLHRFRTKTLPAEEGGLQLNRVLAAGLAEDLQSLESHFSEAKTLLVFLDTFETIEQNPSLAVLHPGQTFPDTYHIPFIRFVVAGRNRLDEAHPNWQKNSLEVVSVPVEPFDRQEMMAYMEAEAISSIPQEEQQITALYEHTEGRPILIGLVTDVLNHRILTLEELLTVQQADFEQYLVEQINFLENPLNWVVLFMAHVYHRFNLDMLEHILKNVDLTEPVREISREMLVETLPLLSFVRQAGTGESFVLHDEMQRLVSRYCWPKHDTDLRIRKAISRSVIEYYEHELADQEVSDQERQVTTIELLYHRLFLDLNVGLRYFEEQIQRAQRLWQLNFARLLLLEASKFRPTMSLAQQNTLQFYEARLLRLEENPASINVIKDLERQADPLWMQQRRANFLLEVGRCYHARSIFKEARAYFTRALDTVQDDQQLKASILSYLGGVCRRQGQLVEAVRFFEQSTTILKSQGNRIDYANTLSTTGSVLAQLGKYEEAMRRCKIALHIREEAVAHKEASEIHIGYGLTTLGIIYLNSGNILEAERGLKRAFDIYSRLDYKAGVAALYNHFGNVELHKGDQEEAQRWFLKGEQAASGVNVGQYINSLNKLGRICLAQGRIQEAFAYLQRAIGRARQVPDNVQLTESLIDLAKVLEQMEQEDEARILLQEAEEIAGREQYANLRAAIELIRAETALRQVHYHEAFRHLEQYCYHTLQHNTSEYSEAVRKTIDVLLTVPTAEQSVIIQELIDAWTSRGLADRYPELIEACKEFQEWSIG